MPRPASSQPTEVELQILRVIWDRGPCGVREIHENLHSAKGTNYSTTVKMLSVMLAKGLVKRTESQRPHIYRAVWTRERTGKSLLKDLTSLLVARIGLLDVQLQISLSTTKTQGKSMMRCRYLWKLVKRSRQMLR